VATSPVHEPVPTLEVEDLKQEVMAGLGAEGFLLRDVQRAVDMTFRPGDSFSDAFRKGLELLTQWRRAGASVRINTPVKKIKVGALQGTTAPRIASDPPGKRPPGPERRGADTQAQPPLPPAAANAEDAAKDRVHIPTHGAVAQAAAPSAQPITPPPSSARRDLLSLPPQLNGHNNGADREKVFVNVEISEFAMDRIWCRLTPREKAALLFPNTNEACIVCASS
jgi:hypothetical protein